LNTDSAGNLPNHQPAAWDRIPNGDKISEFGFLRERADELLLTHLFCIASQIPAADPITASNNLSPSLEASITDMDWPQAHEGVGTRGKCKVFLTALQDTKMI
jgi:hypothetical protein